MPQGDARLARDKIGLEHSLAPFGFERSFQRPKRRHPAARRNLQPHMAFADGQSHHAVRSNRPGRLQGHDTQREACRLQFRRSQHLFQGSQVVLRNADQHGVVFAARRLEPRRRNMQRLDITRKASFGLDLQEAGKVCLRQLGHFDLGGERPFERQANHTLALPNPLGIEVIANFPPNQFGIIRQWIKRKRHGEGPLNVQHSIDAPQDDAVQAAAIQGKPQHSGELFAPEQVQPGQSSHCAAFAKSQF